LLDHEEGLRYLWQHGSSFSESPEIVQAISELRVLELAKLVSQLIHLRRQHIISVGNFSTKKTPFKEALGL
jgi:hypothetical protein